MRYEDVRNQTNDSSAFFDLMAGIIGFCFSYIPFLMITIFVGKFLHKNFTLEFIPSAIIGIIAGWMAYFLILIIEDFSDDLKQKGNRFYILIKLLVAVFVAGMPFLLGVELGVDLIKDPTALFSKFLTGAFFGFLFAIPVYIKVILSRKEL